MQQFPSAFSQILDAVALTFETSVVEIVTINPLACSNIPTWCLKPLSLPTVAPQFLSKAETINTAFSLVSVL